MPAPKNNRSRNGSSINVALAIDSGAGKLRKKIRDIERLLKRDSLPADVRINNERLLKALQALLATTEVQNKARHMLKKYHMVRFFESKKAHRKATQAQKAVAKLEAEGAPKKDIKKARKVLQHAQVDVAYVLNFPKTEKYIALYVDELLPEDEKSRQGVLATNQKRQAFRKQCAEMLQEGTLPVAAAVPEKKPKKNAKEAAPEEDDFFE